MQWITKKAAKYVLSVVFLGSITIPIENLMLSMLYKAMEKYKRKDHSDILRTLVHF